MTSRVQRDRVPAKIDVDVKLTQHLDTCVQEQQQETDIAFWLGKV
jgi:hypothetical protein